MRAVYAIALITGTLGVMAWVVMAAVAATVAGRESADPERRFGDTGRSVVAGLLGFGMGGISATFGGWPAPLAFLGAVVLAVVLALGARWLAGRVGPA